MIKGRVCQEKFREDVKALRRYVRRGRSAAMLITCHLVLPFVCRSGTEEYSELHQLLEVISSYLRDFNTIRAAEAAERAAQSKKAEEDKCKGEKNAMCSNGGNI